MAASKKKTAVAEEATPVEAVVEEVTPVEEVATDTIEEPAEVTPVTEEVPVVEENVAPVVEEKQKYATGSIVFVAKDADADLNGFKLFPQYKKYTYTVESYDSDSQVYTLRRLNLTLRLKESDIVAPNERAHDSLNRKQF